MARTIEAPGVEIREVDLSLRSSLPVGTKILMHGYASQGPTNELIQVSNKSELDEIFFGNNGPTNAAERYFYYSANEILNSPATLYVTRFPYGSGDGTGFNGEYTALAFPVSANNTFSTALSYKVGTPSVITLTEAQYDQVKSGEIGWSNTASATIGTNFTDLSTAGFVIVNDAKTTINEYYEGYYVALADNRVDPVSGFSQVSGVNTLNTGNTTTLLNNSLLGFTLTGDGTLNSISELVENSTNYNFSDSSFKDSLIMYIFRLRTSNTESDPTQLYYVPIENYVGSLDASDQRASSVNGQMDSFYLESKVNNASNYIRMFVNSNIATNGSYDSLQKVNTQANMSPIGSYTPCSSSSSTLKNIGAVDSKITRALRLCDNIQELDIDIVAGAGLETIFAYTATTTGGNTTFDDTKSVADIMSQLSSDVGSSSVTVGYHKTIFNLYNNFCQQTRKDCIHYSDPLRAVFVQGNDFKTLDNKSRTYTQNILTPMKNLYATANSNYSATYANWIKVYDSNSSQFVWIPFSGWQAAITARMDAALQPWYAPFGLNNGVIRNITDIAFRPNQKQQEGFYRLGINPVVYFQGDGFVVWGQKTLQAKPSAFDRINVRRLFLVLERATMKVMRYFVGEPNTVFTRSRVSNILKPIFDLAKNNEGCYDYLIICDERNNTPSVIDNNEMKVDIYIKPVRTAEFILVTFYATRTDQDFNELIG